MLREVFINIISKYTDDVNFINGQWDHILREYSGQKRYYHNLEHLRNIYQVLIPVKAKIENWDAVLFCLFYHDIIYKVSKNNNEKKSAEFAKKVLEAVKVTKETVELVYDMITATKGHSISSIKDINYFTDADLSILGKPRAEYIAYMDNVRKEYKMYPNFMYTKGRVKVLEHFLGMERIYKTSFFYENFEVQAKDNITFEIKTLS